MTPTDEWLARVRARIATVDSHRGYHDYCQCCTDLPPLLELVDKLHKQNDELAEIGYQQRLAFQERVQELEKAVEEISA